jgi:dCTP diphosphatase
MDANTTLAAIKSEVAQFASERDWEQFHAPKNLSMAIAAEAAELMEHYLWCSPVDSVVITAERKKRSAVAEELADVIILALQFANMTGIDVATAISAKLEMNRAKYPIAKARGRSNKYTEL